jgi:hypothetical protein
MALPHPLTSFFHVFFKVRGSVHLDPRGAACRLGWPPLLDAALRSSMSPVCTRTHMDIVDSPCHKLVRDRVVSSSGVGHQPPLAGNPE